MAQPDEHERILPDRVTLPGTAAGIALAFGAAIGWPFAPAGDWWDALWAGGWAAIAALGAGWALWLIGRLWRFVRPGIETAMGEGDVKMMAMVGAFLGARLSVLTIFLGSLLGTLIFVLTRLMVLVIPAREASPQAKASAEGEAGASRGTGAVGAPADLDGAGGIGGPSPGPISERRSDACADLQGSEPAGGTLAAAFGPLRRGLEAAGFIVEGRGAGLLDQIPFGSMLAIGAAAALLWGETLTRAYTSLSLSLGDWLYRLLGGGA